jgi:hypothetical protein
MCWVDRIRKRGKKKGRKKKLEAKNDLCQLRWGGGCLLEWNNASFTGTGTFLQSASPDPGLIARSEFFFIPNMNLSLNSVLYIPELT